MTTYHGNFGTPQTDTLYHQWLNGIETQWDCDRQTTLPDCEFPPPVSTAYVERREALAQTVQQRLQNAGYAGCEIVDTTVPRQSPPIEHAADDGIPLGYHSPVTWTGKHPLTGRIVDLVSRIDYVTSDEDQAQDMLCSLLQRSHTVRNSGDWRKAVRYAIRDARRKAAHLSRSGESLESIAYDPDRDHRKDQLPGPIKPYDGPEPQVRETINQPIVRTRVMSAESAIGAYRFDRSCQVTAYVME